MTALATANLDVLDAIVLAGGFGTRLASRVPGRPKSLAPVGGRPFLALQLDWLALQPVGRVIVTAHHLADQMDAFVRAYDRRPLPLEIVHEEKPLGTGGAVLNAIASGHLSNPVLVINGDTYFGFDIEPALAHHRRTGAAATIIVARIGDASRYGQARLTGDWVAAFDPPTGRNEPGLVSAGAYLIDPERLGEAPAAPFSIERDLFPRLAAQKALAAFVIEGEDAFFDIGVPDAYDSFRTRITAANGAREGISQLCIGPEADLREAMRAINQSSRGICVICEKDNRALGVLTDGNIRRALLSGGQLGDQVTQYMTRDFVSVNVATPKEQTLKLLDVHIRAIPVLDDQGRVVDIVGTGYVPTRIRDVYARARAPVRISLSGGGTDFTDYYMQFGGVCLTATVNHHSHAVLRKRDDRRAVIVSRDMKQTVEVDDIDDLVYDGRLDLLKAGVRVMQPDFGFELHVACDVPPGSGLGGSASLLGAVIGCFNEFRDENRLDSYAIAEHTFEAERVELEIAGGWQDQYATAFGGFNFIEFTSERNIVTPLRLAPATIRELEERLVLCWTGRAHGGRTTQEYNKSRRKGDPASLKIAEEYKQIATEMKSRLLRGAFDDFGQLLDRGWQLKRRYGVDVSNPEIDAVYRAARAAGAEGGRLLGTGGGGFFLFAVPPFGRVAVIEALETRGLKTESVIFENDGLQSWTVRG